MGKLEHALNRPKLDAGRGGAEIGGMRDPDWMTVSDIAHELGVSTDTVLRLIHERQLRAQILEVRGHHTIRVRVADWEAFRDAHVIGDSRSSDWE